jgi:hypothetical protein
MARPVVHPYPPRPSDPIRCAADALRVFALAMKQPPEHETIAFLLDNTSRSDTITIISGTAEPDSIVGIAECMAMAGAQVASLCGLVLATVRPDADAIAAGDIDRWIDAAAITETHGIELIEWFVVTAVGVVCPRELLGDPPRW